MDDKKNLVGRGRGAIGHYMLPSTDVRWKSCQKSSRRRIGVDSSTFDGLTENSNISNKCEREYYRQIWSFCGLLFHLWSWTRPTDGLTDG